MENEETKVDEKLKSAFNDGYLLGLHKSELADSLRKNYTKAEKMDVSGIEMLVEGIGEGISANERNIQVERNLKSIQRLRDSNEIDRNFSPERE